MLDEEAVSESFQDWREVAASDSVSQRSAVDDEHSKVQRLWKGTEWRTRRSERGSGEWSVRGGSFVLMAVFLAFAIDMRMRRAEDGEGDKKLMATDFETNPLLSGWLSVGSGAEWTDAEQVSGRRAIALRQATWVSPAVQSEQLSWYRLAFRSKAPGAVENAGGVGYGRCAVVFSNEHGELTPSNVELTVYKSEEWQKSDLRFRAHPAVDGAGNLSAATMRVEFQTVGSQPYYVDELVLEKTAAAEVSDWADQFYSKLPAKLKYLGKGSRWQRLKGTMEKLRNHQRLRIVVLGDGIQGDLANAPIDVFLGRLYPGCTVEIVPSIKAGAGVSLFKDHMAEYVMRLKPDLLIVGGVSNTDEMRSFQSVVDQVRAHNTLARRNTEILLLTNGWSANAVGDGAFRFTSDMRELDQVPGNNVSVPDDFRGHLMQFAAENGVEFVDMMGIASEFIFGPAAIANVGPPTGVDGVPYSYWMRDWLHPDESGKQIMGRILEAYFAPSEVDGTGSRQARQELKSAPVRLFDPERNPRDQEAFAAARREFGTGAVERPALALNFGEVGNPGNRRVVEKSATFRLPGQPSRERGYIFDEPLDVRTGDVAVYWSFRTDRTQGEDKGSMTMHLCFTEPSAGGRDDRAHVSLTVRPGAASILGVGGGVLMENGMEHMVEVPVENFMDPTKVAKFRLLLRWAGGDRVVVEAASWNPRSKSWDGFIPFDRPGALPLVMELNTRRHLLGTTSFKSIHFESQSTVPVLEAALVTMRPSLIR